MRTFPPTPSKRRPISRRRQSAIAWTCMIGSSMLALPVAAQDFHGVGLAGLAPLVGKTWVGEDLNRRGERTVSVEQWDWILGRKAVRVTQSVNNGELGMQYTYFADPLTHQLSFHAVSTLGPYSTGTVRFSHGRMIRREVVVGSPPLDTVLVTSAFAADGRLVSRSSYFRRGKPIPGGHEYRYHVDAAAKPTFVDAAP